MVESGAKAGSASWVQAHADVLQVARERADRPSDAQRPEPERHVLLFEVSGATLAVFREAMAWLRGQGVRCHHQ